MIATVPLILRLTAAEARGIFVLRGKASGHDALFHLDADLRWITLY